MKPIDYKHVFSIYLHKIVFIKNIFVVVDSVHDRKVPYH